MNTRLTSMCLVLFTLFTFVASFPLNVVQRDVFVPPVTYPGNGTVWKIGGVHNVTWYGVVPRACFGGFECSSYSTLLQGYNTSSQADHQYIRYHCSGKRWTYGLRCETLRVLSTRQIAYTPIALLQLIHWPLGSPSWIRDTR